MKPKIMVLLPIWGRMNITELCLSNLSKLKDEYNLDVLCVISEQWAKLMAFKYGFKWVEVSNDDLGHKMNFGVEKALKYDFDYLMNLGSDDIITKELLDEYKKEMESNAPMFGVTKVCFFDSQTKELKEVNYGHLIGAGRMIRRDVLCKYTLQDGKINMYDKGLKNGLDNNSRKRFMSVGMRELNLNGNFIIDIKSEENIWKFSDLKGEIKELNYIKNIDDEILTQMVEL